MWETRRQFSEVRRGTCFSLKPIENHIQTTSGGRRLAVLSDLRRDISAVWSRSQEKKIHPADERSPNSTSTRLLSPGSLQCGAYCTTCITVTLWSTFYEMSWLEISHVSKLDLRSILFTGRVNSVYGMFMSVQALVKHSGLWKNFTFCLQNVWK